MLQAAFRKANESRREAIKKSNHKLILQQTPAEVKQECNKKDRNTQTRNWRVRETKTGTGSAMQEFLGPPDEISPNKTDGSRFVPVLD